MKKTAKKGRLFVFFRKVLPVFAATLVMLCINPRTAYAADIYASGDDWELDTDGHLTISNQEGMEEWAPIGEAMTYRIFVKSVTIEQGVTSIPNSAFRSHYELTSVTIPDGVTSIGSFAFYGCDSLRSITIPDGVTSIGDHAFDRCSSLTSITIPDSVTSIGDFAFEFCESLQNITIPDGVTSIGDSAFSSCSNLQSITVPASVTSIGDHAFFGCMSLKSSITIPDGVTSIGDHAFSSCISLPSVKILDGVTIIGTAAFQGCSSLRSITIPASVTEIGDSVFCDCTSLEEVTILGTSPPRFTNYNGQFAFEDTAFVTRNEKGIRVPMKALNNYMTEYAGWQNWREYIYGYNAPLNFDPTAEDYADTDIDVLGFTEDATVYSVDVEWGAMTFQYENTTWDAIEHKTVAGAGWKVYDSVKNEALDTRTDAINRIQVMNHSNAGIWATLAYAGADDYADTSGSFEKKADDTDTDYDETGEYLFLATADNAAEVSEAGIPTVGTVYFMPSGIKEEYKKSDGIEKWSQLGTITVGVLTKKP